MAAEDPPPLTKKSYKAGYSIHSPHMCHNFSQVTLTLPKDIFDILSLKSDSDAAYSSSPFKNLFLSSNSFKSLESRNRLHQI